MRFATLLMSLALSASPAFAEAPVKAEVIHWWTSGGEAAAVKVFAEAFQAAGGQWVDNAIAGGGGETARSAAINRVVGGNPPAMMQFNTGKQLDELVADGYLADLDKAAAAGRWDQILPKPIAEAAKRDGHYYALPVNIHGQNWLFYNAKVFADAGLQPPRTWPDAISAGRTLKAKGLIGLAHGGQPWQDRVLFDAVMLGEGGRDLYLQVYGEGAAKAIASPAFKHVAEVYKSLRDLMDAGMPGRNWNDATALVITGKAGFQIQGDWAKGEFLSAGETPGKEYGCVVIGANGYIMGGDVFVFPKPKDANAAAAQAKLEGLMLSPEVQLAFNAKKGSVPARTDLDVSSLDVCARQGEAMLKDPNNQIPSNNYLVSPDENGALDDVITQYLNSPAETADQFVQKFAAAVKSAG